jgi:4-hydroxybenzoate polyprenyltransferase
MGQEEQFSPAAAEAPAADASVLRSNIVGLVKTMRPQQWTKNAIVYAGLVFDGKLLQLDLLLLTTAVALCFCLASSSVYILNDLVDMAKDRRHPRKRLRPLPNGQLNPRFAMAASILLSAISIIVTTWIDVRIGAILGLYLVQNVAYSFYLKNIVLIDVMVLSLGFLLRVVAGVLVVNVSNFSPWLYVCVTLLALFLGFGKRRHEITLLAGQAAAHRASLGQYNLPLLDQIIGIVTTSIIITYTLYTFEAQTAMAGNGQMLLTVPFVFYGIARYLYLIHVEHLGGAPDELLLKDRHLIVTCLLWMLTVVVLIYWW